jgi:hypothetical protein
MSTLPAIASYLALVTPSAMSLPRILICLVGVVLSVIYLHRQPYLLGLVAGTYSALILVVFFPGLQRWEFYVAAMLTLGLAAFLGRPPVKK